MRVVRFRRVFGFTGALLLAVAVPLRAGLVAYYDFEDGSGTTITDRSGNGHDATLQNPDGTDWVAGRVGAYALDLSGSLQWASVANGLPSQLGVGGAHEKSVTCWVYTRAFNDGAPFCMGWSATAEMFCLRTLPTVNQWRAQFYSTPDFDMTITGSASAWRHLALVYDGTKNTVYVDGLRLAYKNATLNTTDGRAFEIGRYNGANYFNGIVDELRVYDHALLPSDVQALAGKALDASERVAASFTLSSAEKAAVAGFAFEQTRGGTTISTIDLGENLLDGLLAPNNPGALQNDGTVALINHGGGSYGDFGSDLAWIGADNFAVRALGVLDIPAPGNYSFAVYSDDGFRLRLGKSGYVFGEYATGRSGKTVMMAGFAEAGLYPLELTYFEQGGGEGLELQYWAGSDPAGTPVLLNDTNAGSIAVYQGVYDVADRYAAPTTAGAGAEFVTARHAGLTGYTVNSLYEARQLLDGNVTPSVDRREALNTIDFTALNGMPADQYGGEFTGVLNVPTPGVHTFTCGSDDGFRLEIGADYRVLQEANYPKGASAINAKAAFLAGGLYPFRLTWFEKTGGNEVHFTIDGMQLNNAALGVDIYPMPGAKYPVNASGERRFRVVEYDTESSVPNIYAAWGYVDGTTASTACTTTHVGVIDYYDTSGAGNFSVNNPFPLNTGGDDNYFVLTAFGYVTIPVAGFWTFGVNSDDGFQLELGNQCICQFAGGKGASDVLSTVYVPEAGSYRLYLLYFENTGGAECELFAAQGVHAAFNPTDFHLVGDVANGGLPVYLPNGGTVFTIR